MAITANVDLGNGVTASSCYIIVPIAYVKKFDDADGADILTTSLPKPVTLSGMLFRTYDLPNGTTSPFEFNARNASV